MRDGPESSGRSLARGLRDAARRFGTPAFVTDAFELERAARTVRDAFPDPWLRAFSLKANDVAGLVARIAGLGFDANVVSRGEWAVARRAGLPNARITLEGIGKTSADLRAAIDAAVSGAPLRWLAVESLDEADDLAARMGGARSTAASRSLDVLLRLNPEVAPETLPGLAVGVAASKFGMSASEVTEAVERLAAVPGIAVRGVHLHVGSQLRAVDAWRDAVRRGLALVALVRGSRPEFDTLDVGGGFPVLPGGEAAPGPARFARELPALLEDVPLARRPERFAIEPGRALVARAGYLVARVLHVRERGGRQVVLDAGMTELIRPALYGARHDIVALTSGGRAIDDVDRLDDRWTERIAGSPPGAAAGRASSAGARAAGSPAAATARVEGPVCESTDHLGEHALPPLRRGDLVAILDAGAYAASLSSTYNGRPRPPQLLLEADGRLTLLRRRGATAALG